MSAYNAAKALTMSNRHYSCVIIQLCGEKYLCPKIEQIDVHWYNSNSRNRSELYEFRTKTSTTKKH